MISVSISLTKPYLYSPPTASRKASPELAAAAPAASAAAAYASACAAASALGSRTSSPRASLSCSPVSRASSSILFDDNLSIIKTFDTRMRFVRPPYAHAAPSVRSDPRAYRTTSRGGIPPGRILSLFTHKNTTFFRNRNHPSAAGQPHQILAETRTSRR